VSTKKASFHATYTASVQVSGPTKDYEDTYNILVAKDSVTVGVFNWDFTYIDDTYNTIVEEIGSSTIENVQISFQYNNNVDAINIKVLDYDGSDPKMASANDVISAIQSSELGEADIISTNKTGVIVDLDDSSNLYYRIMLAIAQRESVTVGLSRDPAFDSSVGSVELSGKTLVGGSSEWRSATATEPIDPPLLILTYTVDEDAHPVLNMKYTTSDPTSAQNTPENSIGGYLSLNNIYTNAAIGDSINSTQTTIPVAATSVLPLKVGLASVGPEVFKYNVIDATDHQLSSIERGISPLSSFPAGFDSFKIPERIQYLSTNDSNVHLLFNTRPAGDGIQYRCVAIANTDTNDDFSIRRAVLGVVQNPNAKAQIRIGIEFPRWDARSGTATSGTTSTLLVTSDQAANGFFDGAFLKLTDPSGSVSYAIVDSYAYSGTGEFILDRTVTGLTSTWNYVIMPAPSQSILNDNSAPGSNSGRFTGFSETVEGIDISLTEHGDTMQENDLFYVWLRRSVSPNSEAEDETGAILIFRYRDI